MKVTSGIGAAVLFLITMSSDAHAAPNTGPETGYPARKSDTTLQGIQRRWLKCMPVVRVPPTSR